MKNDLGPGLLGRPGSRHGNAALTDPVTRGGRPTAVVSPSTRLLLPLPEKRRDSASTSGGKFCPVRQANGARNGAGGLRSKAKSQVIRARW